MASAPSAAIFLAAILLLAGCTSPPPSSDGSTSATSIPDTALSHPTGGPEGLALVTVDAEGYGLAPVSQSKESVAAWAEQYCARAELSPCTGIEDRSAPLCIEKWDCHPALLVPFEQGVAAFVSGGVFQEPHIFAVWRTESDPEAAKYGGARRILDEYLLTVGVCPDNGSGNPRGTTCR